MFVLAVVLLALLVQLGAPPPVVAEGWRQGAPARVVAEGWRPPVDGVVVREFRVAKSPFARGQHRGVDFSARRGARVRAACAGRVRFAGRVPSRGRVVSVVCGHLLATHLGLVATTVRRGDAVLAGSALGAAGGGTVQLGARRIGSPFGYVDPLRLMEAPAGSAPGPAPVGRRGRGPTTRGGVRAAAETRAAQPGEVSSRRDDVRPVEGGREVPAIVWAGLGLLLSGLSVGGLARRREGRRRRAAVVVRPGRTG